MKRLEASEAAKNALKCVLEAKKGEHITIFCDREKLEVSEMFVVGAIKLGLKARLVRLKSEANVFREKVPPEIVAIFEKQPADIYINLLRGVREETSFRIELTKMETETHRTRLAHCPGIMMDMLTGGALALTIKGHEQMQSFAQKMIRKLGEAVEVEVTNPSGTHITMSVKGRPFFTDTVLDRKTLKWMNLPTGEVIVAPVEDSLEGKLVCDMAIGGIGPINKPLEVIARKGKAYETSSQEPQVLKKVRDSLKTDSRADIVGEFAFGINRKARFVQEFLESEKVFGTIHVAFGNNSDLPCGKNPSKNHMDLLVSKPTVKVTKKDGTTVEVLKAGTFKKTIDVP
jgi:leucyl aminopeptidase (aminopeptidase T)